MSSETLASIALSYDYDLVAARRWARQVAAALSFDGQDQTRLATVTSEIARNALRYGGGGWLSFHLVSDASATQQLQIEISDRGKGIADLEAVLDGRYRSSSGMGLGILGARRLMDQFSIRSSPERGTVVVMAKNLPAGSPALSVADVTRIRETLASRKAESPIEEIQHQNTELLQALSSLNERQDELQRVNQELEDTNRGVLALYAELDDQAERVRHSDELKTRFLSDMSHEFRTPVNSILALARLVEEGVLSDDARTQLSLIRRSADELAALVNDLLDLAKIEAGKVDVRPTEVEVANIFSALRGMLRPLLLNRSLSLVFEDGEGLPVMYTDEAKVSQILRNFISNALKFTVSGEVRVTAKVAAQEGMITFSVTDTGIGIDRADLDRVFEEFTQIDSPIQSQVRGTGLGLPLTKKLAALLGGTVRVKSERGIGSTFYADLPVVCPGFTPVSRSPEAPPDVNVSVPATHGSRRVLVIDDDETTRYALVSFATAPGTIVLEAENGLAGLSSAKTEHPDVILLDLMMPGIGGHEVMARLKADPSTADIPVVIVTSRFVNDDERQQILTRAHGFVYKGDLSREVVTGILDDALRADHA